MATATDSKQTDKQKENKQLEATVREAGNKNAARRVRMAGQIPAIVYGAGKESVSLSVDPRHVLKILYSETGHNTIFDLSVAGEQTKVMIVDWQFEPIKSKLLHIDLQRIAMDKKLTVTVPIVLQGEAEGVKLQGGLMEQVLREVEIKCLPADIPGHIDADVSQLVFGTVLRVSDLPKSDKIEYLTDADQTVAHIVTVKEEVVAAPEVEAAAAAATTGEPEVIKKGKQETEGEDAGEKDKDKKEKKDKK